MKSVLAVFSLVGLMAEANQLQADLPGGYNQYAAYIHVYDQDGNPLSGILMELYVQTWYGDELNPDTYICTKTGTTDNWGYLYLECLIAPEFSEGLDWIKVTMLDNNYTVISSENTASTTWAFIYPVFDVVYDTDGDSLDDNLELQLAEKFSPVLHRHSWEKQQGLSNVDWMLTGKATLKAWNIVPQEVYSSTISEPSELHVYQGSGDRDSFGEGEIWTEWRLNFDDTYRHQGAPVGQRPLYYHVYKQGSYYFVQYWFFFNMNDVQDQTNNNTWHEGDFEHVSIKVNSSLDPVAVNFYRHEGGRTISPSNCWWSATIDLTYTGMSQGYSPNRTHLHVWIAANSHAAYNRYDKVYKFVANEGQLDCVELVNEFYIDNVDYEPSGYDLYFEYDYLEKLGEIKSSPLQLTSEGDYKPYAHGYFWYSHWEPRKNSKIWLCFVGRFGQHWVEVCLGQPVSSKSPLSPVFDLPNKPSHEWKTFTEDYSIYGFGNPVNDPFYAYINIEFISDPPYGD